MLFRSVINVVVSNMSPSTKAGAVLGACKNSASAGRRDAVCVFVCVCLYVCVCVCVCVCAWHTACPLQTVTHFCLKGLTSVLDWGGWERGIMVKFMYRPTKKEALPC